MLSEGVALGAVQIAAGGQPIIMFVEQQTTGGYPKIANVIAADMHCVGQLRPRDEVRFARVGLDEAREALRKQQRLIGAGEIFR
jgi:antagonist of KipI